MTEKKSLLFSAETFKDSQTFFKQRIETFVPNFSPKVMLEIGGSVAQNAGSMYPNAKYTNCDLRDSDKVITIVCDVTKEISLPSNSVDFVYTNDTFEHLAAPWVTGQEITRILKPDGICFCNTLFAWRYHPVPGDFFRFSPTGLTALFPELNKLEANFNNFWRRHDSQGFWESKLDSVPLDELGGWRENWKVYYIGQKNYMEAPLYQYEELIFE